jgi:hypothetical protein
VRTIKAVLRGREACRRVSWESSWARAESTEREGEGVGSEEEAAEVGSVDWLLLSAGTERGSGFSDEWPKGPFPVCVSKIHPRNQVQQYCTPYVQPIVVTRPVK